MREQTKTKKKMSSFGKLWFSLLLAAEVLPLWYLVEGWSFRIFQDQLLFIFQVPTILYVILTCVWLFVGRKKWLFPGKWVALSPLPILLRWLSTLWLPHRMYTFSIISEIVFTFLFATFLPILSLVVLWVLYGQSLKKAPKKANVVGSLTYANSTVTIPMGESEQVLLERTMLFNLLKITVTNKRVMYKGILWKRVNLPLNRISAVGTSIFCSLHIGSSAGRIHMIFFGRYREVYEVISALLNNVE